MPRFVGPFVACNDHLMNSDFLFATCAALHNTAFFFFRKTKKERCEVAECGVMASCALRDSPARNRRSEVTLKHPCGREPPTARPSSEKDHYSPGRLVWSENGVGIVCLKSAYHTNHMRRTHPFFLHSRPSLPCDVHAEFNCLPPLTLIPGRPAPE